MVAVRGRWLITDAVLTPNPDDRDGGFALHSSSGSVEQGFPGFCASSSTHILSLHERQPISPAPRGATHLSFRQLEHRMLNLTATAVLFCCAIGSALLIRPPAFLPSCVSMEALRRLPLRPGRPRRSCLTHPAVSGLSDYHLGNSSARRPAIRHCPTLRLFIPSGMRLAPRLSASLVVRVGITWGSCLLGA